MCEVKYLIHIFNLVMEHRLRIHIILIVYEVWNFVCHLGMRFKQTVFLLQKKLIRSYNMEWGTNIHKDTHIAVIAIRKICVTRTSGCYASLFLDPVMGFLCPLGSKWWPFGLDKAISTDHSLFDFVGWGNLWWRSREGQYTSLRLGYYNLSIIFSIGSISNIFSCTMSQNQPFFHIHNL